MGHHRGAEDQIEFPIGEGQRREGGIAAELSRLQVMIGPGGGLAVDIAADDPRLGQQIEEVTGHPAAAAAPVQHRADLFRRPMAGRRRQQIHGRLEALGENLGAVAAGHSSAKMGRRQGVSVGRGQCMPGKTGHRAIFVTALDGDQPGMLWRQAARQVQGKPGKQGMRDRRKGFGDAVMGRQRPSAQRGVVDKDDDAVQGGCRVEDPSPDPGSSFGRGKRIDPPSAMLTDHSSSIRNVISCMGMPSSAWTRWLLDTCRNRASSIQ